MERAAGAVVVGLAFAVAPAQATDPCGVGFEPQAQAGLSGSHLTLDLLAVGRWRLAAQEAGRRFPNDAVCGWPGCRWQRCRTWSTRCSTRRRVHSGGCPMRCAQDFRAVSKPSDRCSSLERVPVRKPPNLTNGSSRRRQSSPSSPRPRPVLQPAVGTRTRSSSAQRSRDRGIA